MITTSLVSTDTCLKVVPGTESSGDPSEQALYVVEAGEGDARRHWAFHEVHGQTLVKAPHHPLLSAMVSVTVEVWISTTKLFPTTGRIIISRDRVSTVYSAAPQKVYWRFESQS